MAVMINHHTLAVTFGILGNVISFLVFLAPLPTFYRIYKKKSTESFGCLPYLVALFSSMLWLYYAMIKGNAFLLITINSFGCVIETIYVALFLSYATIESRRSALKVLVSLNLGAFSLILIVTHFLLKGNQLQVLVLGWICVAFSVSVFAAPLSIVAHVVKTKSVEFMPFILSLFLTLSAVMWFGYGLFLKDICIAIPNVIGFLLGLVQMTLYLYYKNIRRVQDVPKETNLQELPVKNNVIFRTVGDDGLVPVEIQPYVSDKDETKDTQYAAAAADQVAVNHDHQQPKKQDKSPELPSGNQHPDESPV